MDIGLIMNNKSYGFTMIELIITIALMGILSVAISQFIKMPINAYDDTARRALLVDEAHLLIKKIKRDVQSSLPNSIRISTSGNKVFLEMMLVASGGKYRSQLTDTGTGAALDFTTANTSFDMLSSSYTFTGNEKIVINNLGLPGYDAYAGDNISNYSGTTGVATSLIKFNSKKFPLESNGDKFYIVNDVVTYVCDKTAKTMTRYNGYAPTAIQPVNDLIAPLSTSTKGLIGRYLNDCRFTYNQGSNSRNNIFSIFMNINRTTEFINLYGESYVPNN
jgi:MSHA biogenesis protein MshO